MKNAFYDTITGTYKDCNGNPFPLDVWRLSSEAITPLHDEHQKGIFLFFIPGDKDICIQPNQVLVIDMELAIRLPEGLLGYFVIYENFQNELIIQDYLIQQTKRLTFRIANICPYPVVLSAGVCLVHMMLFNTNLSVEINHVNK